tara:strand:- start:4307 stop:5413 length:1107 start_codon:yes stop_codon:yes gene_type:complete
MSDFKVRAMDDVEQKSKAQVEEELLQKHEEQFVDAEVKVEAPANETTVETTEGSAEDETKSSFSDEDVLSYIGERYGKTINSLDELLEERETAPELPEDVAAYFKYKQETGRTIEDFVKLNRDFSKVDQDEMLINYYKATDEYLDDEDVASMIEEFSFDAEYDEEKEIKKKKLAKKKAVSQARKFFEEQKEQYKMPLESSSASIDSKLTEELEGYRAQLKEAEENDKKSKVMRDSFLQKVEEVFNDNFKGFEFKIDDQVISYTPAEANTLKSSQKDMNNFIAKFSDDKGINDHAGFHRSLAIASYPEKFAKFFYEKGKSDAVTTDAKRTKNIDLSVNRAPEVTSKGGMQIKAVTAQSNGNSLKIRKRK